MSRSPVFTYRMKPAGSFCVGLKLDALTPFSPFRESVLHVPQDGPCSEAGDLLRMKPLVKSPFLAWPNSVQLRHALGRILGVALCFGLIFGAAEWITEHRIARVSIAMEWERRIPFLPGFTLIYISAYAVLFPLAPWVLRTKREIDALAGQSIVIILLAGLGFLLIPADLAYPPPEALGGWGPLFALADTLNLDHNLVPSLHVALSTMCVEHYAVQLGTSGRWALRAWGVLIAVSTLLLHQHHVFDVLAGYALALGVWNYGQRRLRHSLSK